MNRDIYFKNFQRRLLKVFYVIRKDLVVLPLTQDFFTSLKLLIVSGK